MWRGAFTIEYKCVVSNKLELSLKQCATEDQPDFVFGILFLGELILFVSFIFRLWFEFVYSIFVYVYFFYLLVIFTKSFALYSIYFFAYCDFIAIYILLGVSFFCKLVDWFLTYSPQ